MAQNATSTANARGAAKQRAASEAERSRKGSGAPAAGSPRGKIDVETGERDENYNLISVLYHALQGAQTYSQYVRDAQAAGDEELVEFFSEVREEEQDRAERAKELLAARLGGEAEEDEDDEEDDED
ncbi:MAG TPA: hypothetical protein VK524_26545 [Polyangiaceae bacterium]|nr:hypothetical protein [Polyangiaceae bacterium]